MAGVGGPITWIVLLQLVGAMVVSDAQIIVQYAHLTVCFLSKINLIWLCDFNSTVCSRHWSRSNEYFDESVCDCRTCLVYGVWPLSWTLTRQALQLFRGRSNSRWRSDNRRKASMASTVVVKWNVFPFTLSFCWRNARYRPVSSRHSPPLIDSYGVTSVKMVLPHSLSTTIKRQKLAGFVATPSRRRQPAHAGDAATSVTESLSQISDCAVIYAYTIVHPQLASTASSSKCTHWI